MVGVALLGTIGTALTCFSVSTRSGEKAIQGAIILVALVSDAALDRLGKNGINLIAAGRHAPHLNGTGASRAALFPNNEWILLIVLIGECSYLRAVTGD
jgi:hypothetical protein